MRSISDLLENSALKTPKKPAIIFDDSVYTYDDILKKSELLSNYLQEKISPQNVVSILCENSVDFIISYFGILKSGLVAHIIPPNISDRNLIEQINETDSKLIFASKNFNGKIERTNLEKITNFSINELCALQKNSSGFVGNNFYETSSIIFTSGTTSKPKGVKLQHKNILTATSNIVDILDMNHDDVEINSLSLSHSFGLGCIHANFMVGSTSLIFRNTINTDEILTKGKEFSATGFVGVPNTFYRILNLNKKIFSF